jgi:hypothetical protein
LHCQQTIHDADNVGFDVPAPDMRVRNTFGSHGTCALCVKLLRRKTELRVGTQIFHARNVGFRCAKSIVVE